MEQKIWNKEMVCSLLSANNLAVAKAVVAIYNNQTESERCDQATHENNGVGFTGVDAPIMTSMAEFYKKNGFLTPKQLAIARNKVKKYWRQLLVEIERNGHQVSYKISKGASNG